MPPPPPSGRRPKGYPTEELVMSVIGIAVFTICALLIAFIIKFKRLRERKYNQLLVNLSMGHLLTGLAYFYGIFSPKTAGPYRLAGHTYSTVALIFLSIDRFIFIQYPFRYATSIACNRAHIGFMVASPLVYTVYFADALMTRLPLGRVLLL